MTTPTQSPPSEMSTSHVARDDDEKVSRVAYLFGAGASHGCVAASGSRQGLLMLHLWDDIRNEVGKAYESDPDLYDLVNSVVSEGADPQHVITFLDGVPSDVHRGIAARLREIFQRVLKDRVSSIYAERDRHPTGLYEALLDMHSIPGCREQIAGVLTLNYENYFEIAAEERHERSLDFGIRIEGSAAGLENPLTYLKLHGSFDWRDQWPVPRSADPPHLWIPPGISKAKAQYPFSALWARAREVLDCDVLRLVGLKLSANDWDLVSLLFGTRFGRPASAGYRVEVINAPRDAVTLSKAMPYLQVQSLYELPDIGPEILAELTAGPVRRFEDLDDREKRMAIDAAGTSRNWFRLWLKHKGEFLLRSGVDLSTPTNGLKLLVEEP